MTFGTVKMPWGLALRAIFNSIWFAETVLQKTVLEEESYSSHRRPNVICLGRTKIGLIFSHFWTLLKILSVVWLLLLSSPRFHIVVSDSDRESFHKIRGEKVMRGQGRSHGAKM